MLTLSYGYQNPENGDKGSVWFPAINFDIVRLNGHTHDGVNSAKIPSSSVTAVVQTALAVNWVAQGGGTYKQNLTLPGGALFDDYGLDCYNNVTGEKLYLTIDKTGASAYDLYINDNTIAVKVKLI